MVNRRKQLCINAKDLVSAILALHLISVTGAHSFHASYHFKKTIKIVVLILSKNNSMKSKSSGIPTKRVAFKEKVLL